jgi:6-pyruvoyltetrahydropterin/6-carboxytetrahydropterin synthase
MYEISKTWEFAAAHRLSGLAEGHKCARVHGHNYLVTVELGCAALDGPGFVVDYGDLAPFGLHLAKHYDHRWLGSGALLDPDGGKTLPVVTFNPTAELLAGHLLAWVREPGNIPALEAAAGTVTVRVGVSETGKTWAWAR